MRDQLVEEWRLTFTLSWEAFQTGNPPVGAVVTDQDGVVVASGRSRRFDMSPPGGQLGGTSLAHAEVNALAQLSPGVYSGHTLWTSLQPCPMCAAAAMSSGIGTVRFAAVDPMWSGAERLPELNAAVADRWPTFVGPLPGWPERWQTLLSALFQLGRDAGGQVVQARRERDPVVVALAERMRAAPEWLNRFSGGRLDDGLAEMHRLLDREASGPLTESG